MHHAHMHIQQNKASVAKKMYQIYQEYLQVNSSVLLVNTIKNKILSHKNCVLSVCGDIRYYPSLLKNISYNLWVG